MMKTIEYNGKEYPALQSIGFAAQFAFPFAKQLCSGIGLDIGCNRQSWAFVDSNNVPAILIDPELDPTYHAMNLPDGEYDYIVSFHMLEHYIGRFQDTVEYWLTKLKPGGMLFLYLPNCDHQKYWAWGNKKHIHYLSPMIMNDFCTTLSVKKYFVTEGYDLNSSFYCIIEM